MANNIYLKKYNKERVRLGLCRYCNKPAINKWWCEEHRLRKNELARLRYNKLRKNKKCSKCGSRSLETLCLKCRNRSKPLRSRYRLNNKEFVSKSEKRCRHNLKIEVISYYSSGRMCCSLCPEIRIPALTIDHVNGGGNQHRNIIGNNLHRWLKKNRFPVGFRVLCPNCNHLEYLKSLESLPRSNTPQARSSLKRRIRIKREVIDRLGGKCSICAKNDIRILTIHHVNNDGAEHRRSLGCDIGSSKFYLLIWKSGNYTGLECRCFSCNDMEERTG